MGKYRNTLVQNQQRQAAAQLGSHIDPNEEADAQPLGPEQRLLEEQIIRAKQTEEKKDHRQHLDDQIKA